MDNEILKKVLLEEWDILKGIKNRLFDLACELDDDSQGERDMTTLAKSLSAACDKLRALAETFAE